MAHSSVPASTRRWTTSEMAFARPGLHRYTLLAALLLVFVGLVSLVAPTDPDVWWHLRDGQLVLASGIPVADVYSFTASGRPWLVQEWLTEVIMYVVQSTLGYGALSLLFGLFQSAGSLVVYLLLRRAGASRLLALLLLMPYLVFAAPTWGVRPQVLTPLFLGAFLLVLFAYREEPRRTRLLWLLPPLMALWVNMHASYFMGIVCLGIFIVGEAAGNFAYSPGHPVPLKPLLVTGAACLAATLLNPYFLQLWVYPLTYVLHGTSNPLLKYTQEWQSPNFHEPGSLLFGLIMVLAALVGISTYAPEEERRGWRIRLGRKLDITNALLFAAFTLLALQAVRLVPLFGLVALPMMARGLAALWPSLSSAGEQPPPAFEGRVNWLAAIAGFALCAWLIAGAPQAQTGREPRTDTRYRYPVAAASYLDDLPGDTRIYNDFQWGGYLIYRLYPRHLVFIDGRADMYREGIFEDSITLQGAGPGWREVLDRYGIGAALTATGGSLDYALSHDAGWEKAYVDRLAAVYRRAR